MLKHQNIGHTVPRAIMLQIARVVFVNALKNIPDNSVSSEYFISPRGLQYSMLYSSCTPLITFDSLFRSPDRGSDRIRIPGQPASLITHISILFLVSRAILALETSISSRLSHFKLRPMRSFPRSK